MEVNNSSRRIHPLVAAAAVSVMLVSLVGVAAITGVIPTSHSTVASSAALPPTPVSAPVTEVKTPVVSADAKVAADKVVNPPKKHSSTQSTQNHQSYAPRVAKTTQQSHSDQYREPTVVAQAPKICDNCGRVESVNAIQQAAQPSGLGVVAGAVLGGVLGNQVGGGNGKTLATVAGAVGGGYAGNEVEKRTRSTTSYEVRVRMENGTIRTFPFNGQPNWQVGDRIKVVNGYLTSQA